MLLAVVEHGRKRKLTGLQGQCACLTNLYHLKNASGVDTRTIDRLTQLLITRCSKLDKLAVMLDTLAEIRKLPLTWWSNAPLFSSLIPDLW